MRNVPRIVRTLHHQLAVVIGTLLSRTTLCHSIFLVSRSWLVSTLLLSFSFEAPALQNTTKIPREDPQRDTKRAKRWREREEKNAKFWAPHPCGAPPFRGPTLLNPPRCRFGQSRPIKVGQSRCGQSRSNKGGQSRSNVFGQSRFGQSRNWPKSANKDGQSRIGQSRSQPLARARLLLLVLLCISQPRQSMGRNRKWVLEDNLSEAVWQTILRGHPRHGHVRRVGSEPPGSPASSLPIYCPRKARASQPQVANPVKSHATPKSESTH